ncbi:MAG TPA: histidine kinase [Capillimicrobium sp.]|nr:histidine kinase [Capillimicrobium sp.]
MGIAVSMSGEGRDAPQRGVRLTAGIAATATATAIAVLLTLDGTSAHPASTAVARGLSVALPCLVGLYAWHRREGARFGIVLIATGALVFVTALAESPDPWPYTVGRVAGWLVEIALVVLVLSYPSGRLTTRADRLLVAAIALVVLVAFGPRLFLAEQFSVPSPYTGCVDACPDNALMLVDREPRALVSALSTAGLVGVAVVMVLVVLRLARRLVGASPLARAMFGPVLVVAILRVALLAAGISLRDADASVAGLELVAWLLALLVPALAVVSLAGLVRWRTFAGGAMLRLADCLPASTPERLERAFAEAFRDPGVRIVFPTAGGGWCDAWGREVRPPPAGAGRALTPISDGERLVAGLVHDEALLLEPTVLNAGTAIAGTALGSRRLVSEAETALRELRRSRARIASVAERERRRIERDLHDGAQQRLVALRIELELAEELIRTDPERAARRVHALEGRVDEAIDELRALAHGIYPPVLADRGLPEALRAVAARSGLPVTVTAHDVGRYHEVVESAVYFCVLEALQNVVKHAAGVHRVRITLDGGGERLTFSVRDDGLGFGDAGPVGQGLANMRERMATVGGTLTVTSASRVGTTVRGAVPVRPDPA